MIVVDASVLATALSDDGSDGKRARARLHAESVLCAPEVIDLEVAMAWRRQLSAGWLDADGARQALDDLAALNLVRAPHLPLIPRIWELRDTLTPYDAAYVALAEALQATLVTADARSARAPGLRCAVELMQ
ncbi:MAG TPA: type II toxin-antitoxin system VapC family toxin [Solirubrobacteraceae bacterium]|nr:type II toxin-antitoxin system VapC family toxin [Solirubrobacteraceae bacterium]